MRHRKKHSKLSMMSSHRKATLRNMACSLLKYQRIQTRHALAKEARILVERLITISKEDTVLARRRAYEILNDRDLVMRLFKDIAPLCKDRSSGFTRIIPLGFRRGDGAQLAILELTDRKIEEVVTKKKAAKAHAGEVKAVAGKEKAEDAGESRVKKSKEEHKKEAKKDETKAKAAPKQKLSHDEEKRKEMKTADKKSFMKNIRGIFRKKGDM